MDCALRSDCLAFRKRSTRLNPPVALGGRDPGERVGRICGRAVGGGIWNYVNGSAGPAALAFASGCVWTVMKASSAGAAAVAGGTAATCSNQRMAEGNPFAMELDMPGMDLRNLPQPAAVDPQQFEQQQFDPPPDSAV